VSLPNRYTVTGVADDDAASEALDECVDYDGGRVDLVVLHAPQGALDAAADLPREMW
jgi:hypothetical protein